MELLKFFPLINEIILGIVKLFQRTYRKLAVICIFLWRGVKNIRTFLNWIQKCKALRSAAAPLTRPLGCVVRARADDVSAAGCCPCAAVAVKVVVAETQAAS